MSGEDKGSDPGGVHKNEKKNIFVFRSFKELYVKMKVKFYIHNWLQSAYNIHVFSYRKYVYVVVPLNRPPPPSTVVLLPNGAATIHVHSHTVTATSSGRRYLDDEEQNDGSEPRY